MNRTHFAKVLFVLALTGLAGGCNQDAAKTNTDKKNSSIADNSKESSASKPHNSGQSEKIALKAVPHAEVVKAITSNKGKVVLVDFWATYCPPCMEKFPKIVHFQEEYRDKGLVCISVTFDEEDKHARALKFLKDKNATFANYRVENPEACQDQWDFVALPTYLIFDKDGKLSNKFTIDPDAKTQFTVADIQQAIEKQLK